MSSEETARNIQALDPRSYLRRGLEQLQRDGVEFEFIPDVDALSDEECDALLDRMRGMNESKPSTD